MDYRWRPPEHVVRALCVATSEKQVIEVVRLPTATLRIWRALPWNTNPLMRMPDRIEGVVRIVAVVAMLAAIPLAGALGTAVYSSSAAQLRAENATKVEVTATITENPVLVTHVSSAVAAYAVSDDRFDALVSWNENGHVGQATAAVAGGTKLHDRMSLWLDARGRPTTPPFPSDSAAIRAVGTGVGALLGIWSGAAVVVVLAARILDGHRHAMWAREWRLLSRPIGQDK